MTDKDFSDIVPVEHGRSVGFHCPKLAAETAAVDVPLVEEELPGASKLKLGRCVVANRDLFDADTPACGLRNFNVGINSQIVVEYALANRGDSAGN